MMFGKLARIGLNQKRKRLMFNKLFALIESGHEWEVIKEVIVSLEDMFKIFEDDRLKEGAYSAAIDAICEILQEYKTKQLEGK